MSDGATHPEIVQAWIGYEPITQGVSLRCAVSDQVEAEAMVTFPLPTVVRLQVGWQQLRERESDMLVLPGAQPTAVELLAGRDELVLQTCRLRVHVNRQPWQLWVETTGGEVVFAEHIADRSPADGWLAAPLGWERQAKGRLLTRETFQLAPDEGFFGLGEQCASLNHRGRTVRCAVDPRHQATKAIPFVWSTRGYGLFIHSDGEAVFELGSRSPASCTVTLDDEQLDYFLIYGPVPGDILRRYAELTGYAPVPPHWAFGFCLSEPEPSEQRAIEEACATMRARHIPCDGMHIGRPWLGGRDGGCSLAWDREAFPEPAELVAELRAIGFRVGLTIGPYIPRGTSLHGEGLRKGFFVHDRRGRILLRGSGETAQALVDLTLPAARAWWQDHLRPVLAMGVSALLIDDVVEAPDGGVYQDRTPGHLMRNRYSILCQEAVAEVVREQCGQEGLVYARAAWPGSQRTAVHWSGASAGGPAQMMAELRGGLSLGLSGVPFWAHDMGTANAQKDPALYIRSCQLGFLSSFARLHGSLMRDLAAWERDTGSIVREYAQLRHRLSPYIYSSAVAGAQSGLPLVRPLVLAYPDDRNTWVLDRQYLLGEHLLVAPAWEAEMLLEVYLPLGIWVDYWHETVQRGPRWLRYHAPLERLPLLVKAGAIIPTRPLSHYLDEQERPSLTLNVYPQDDGAFVLHDREGAAYELRLQVANDRMELRVPPLECHWDVVLHAVPAPAKVTVGGRSVPCQWKQGRAFIHPGRGAPVVYQAESALATYPGYGVTPVQGRP